ncbi:ABC transporter permease subunit [Kineococcus sp. R8]|uniref:carbohydrate ABC transporter permease n=1 Tax=Kineococcus siccus TaxID=2696567 RepID=UPI001411BC31|nr:sugar ABC transporter permease [Kineococcus siccus]NAZ81821.1 ABC transporter permease subunit [Kineococcus siccus]
MANSVLDPGPPQDGAAAAGAPATASGRTPDLRRQRRRAARYQLAPLLFVAVNVVLFAVFFVWPAATGLWYSFTSYTGVGRAPFVGLENYERLLGDSAFYAALVRTLLFTVLTVPLSYLLSLGLAVLLVSPYTKGKPVARVVFFVPWLISPILVGVIWRWIVGENFGLVNYVVTSLGGDAIAWQSNADLSLVVVAVAAAWSGTAFSMLLFIAAIKNVPASYYEAAAIDGASPWQRFRYITLPGIAPTSFIVVLLSTLGSMKEYALFVALNNGGPGTENNLIVQYIFTTGFQRGQIGYASAASFVLMLILMAIALVQLSVNRRREA